MDEDRDPRGTGQIGGLLRRALLERGDEVTVLSRRPEQLEDESLDGAFNVAAPEPVPQRELMRSLRSALGGRPGLPASRLMAEIGALALRTDTELLLKSRRVVPGRLLDAGFTFAHPTWDAAATDLLDR